MKNCKKCGHECHCNEACEECVNDVCYVCDCENIKDIPDSFTQRY